MSNWTAHQRRAMRQWVGSCVNRWLTASPAEGVYNEVVSAAEAASNYPRHDSCGGNGRACFFGCVEGRARRYEPGEGRTALGELASDYYDD